MQYTNLLFNVHRPNLIQVVCFWTLHSGSGNPIVIPEEDLHDVYNVTLDSPTRVATYSPYLFMA